MDSESLSTIRKVQRLSNEILQHHQALDEASKVVQRAGQELKSKNRSLKRHNNIGKKMSAVGVALIVCPDPFTAVVGVPLFVLGGIVSRTHTSMSLKDIREEANSVVKTLKEYKDYL